MKKPWGALGGGQLGAGHGCEYLEEKAAVVAVVVMARGGAWGGGGWLFGWRALLTPQPAHKSMSPRRRAALIQTLGGLRRIRSPCCYCLDPAPPLREGGGCIRRIRNERGASSHQRASRPSFEGVKVPLSSEEKTDSASSTPAPCRRSSPSAKAAGKSIQISSEAAFPSSNYLACPQRRPRRWERQSSFVKKAARAEP